MVWSLSMTYLGMPLGASFKSNLVSLEKDGTTYYLSPILLVWLIGLGDYRGIIVKWHERCVQTLFVGVLGWRMCAYGDM